MKKNWTSILDTFYGITESIFLLVAGFSTYLIKNLAEAKIHSVKILEIIFLWFLILIILRAIVYEVFKLIISHQYNKDPENYKESGIVINERTRKIENTNRLISISERYKNLEFKMHLLDKYSWLFYSMLILGGVVGMIVPTIV